MRLTCKTAALALMLCAGLGLAAPAHADKGGHGKGHKDDKHHAEHWDYNDDHDTNVIIVIGNNDRTVIRDYVANDWHRHCPPGLAKKHNGCMPPGQAKKRYRIGERLPDNVVFVPVPVELRERLHPVPSGYEYVQVDKDILLISEAGKKVIDAVTLLSAVGK